VKFGLFSKILNLNVTKGDKIAFLSQRMGLPVTKLFEILDGVEKADIQVNLIWTNLIRLICQSDNAEFL